jgi:hypothetical protein
MSGVDFIEHKGKKILYEDFSGLDPESAKPLFEKARAIIAAQPYSSVLALVNLEDVRFNKAGMEMMKDFVKGNTPYIKCSAVYGVDGLMQALYRAIIVFTGRKNLIVFDDFEKAKDYLAGLE